MQALADVTAAGEHRHGVRDELDRRIDEQDAEFFWILFFTGLRLGEAVTLRCRGDDGRPRPTSVAGYRCNATDSGGVSILLFIVCRDGNRYVSAGAADDE